jgi:hypothetical protein
MTDQSETLSPSAAIDRSLGRARGRWNADGLPELFYGVASALWGGAIVAQQRWPSPLTAGLATWLPIIVAVLFAVSGSRAIRALKARTSDPRVGYARPREAAPWRKLVATAAAAVLAAGIVLLVFGGRHDHSFEVLAAPLMGLVLGAAHVGVAVRHGLTRHLAVAVVPVVAGFLCLAMQVAFGLGTGLVLLASGVANTLSGGITFGRLLAVPRTDVR